MSPPGGAAHAPVQKCPIFAPWHVFMPELFVHVRYFSTSSSMSLYSSLETSQSSSAPICGCELCWASIEHECPRAWQLWWSSSAKRRLPRYRVVPQCHWQLRVIPTTNPMPETSRLAPTAPLTIQVVPSAAHVPSRELTALRHFLLSAPRHSISEWRRASSSLMFCNLNCCVSDSLRTSRSG